MTWIAKYRLSVRLASIYSYEFARDIAHDAWLSYMRQKGKDLFEEQLTGYNYYLSKIIRRSFLSWLRKERLFDPKGERYQYFDTEELKSGLTAPDEAVFEKDLYQTLLSKIQNRIHHEKSPAKNNTLLEDVFRLKAQGYEQVVIAEKLNLTKPVVSYYNKQMSLINPFNGNRLKITRTITKSTWAAKTDKDDYELDDYNEFFELYKHKESGQGILVKLTKEK